MIQRKRRFFLNLRDKITDQTTSPITIIRQSGARWIDAISLLLLVLSVLLFIWMWIRACIQGEIPQAPWGKYEGNHGPWHHRASFALGTFTPKYNLRWLWSQVLNLQFFSFVLGLVSIIFKPNRRSAIITALAFISGFLFFITHYWLVD